MASPTIKVKRSSVSGKIPTISQLDLGELAINTFDGKVYTEQDQSSVGVGTTVIVLDPWSVGTGTNTYNTYFNAITYTSVNNWHLSTDGYKRFYFGNTSRTYFGSGSGYVFKDPTGNVDNVTINYNGWIKCYFEAFNNSGTDY